MTEWLNDWVNDWLSDWVRMAESVWQSELVEWDWMCKRERQRLCEGKGLVIEWSSDPLIKGSSDQVANKLSSN